MIKYCVSAFLCCCLSAGCTTNQKSSVNSKNETQPKLLKGSVRKIWIPPELRNNGQEWVEGHYLFRIERGATWSR